GGGRTGRRAGRVASRWGGVGGLGRLSQRGGMADLGGVGHGGYGHGRQQAENAEGSQSRAPGQPRVLADSGPSWPATARSVHHAHPESNGFRHVSAHTTVPEPPACQGRNAAKLADNGGPPKA